jgi:REP element-mobilizing transposase RayT
MGIRTEIHLNDDEFVIMPNHIHGILWIIESASSNVRADGVRPDCIHLDNDIQLIDRGASLAPPQSSDVYHAPQRKPKSLSSFIAGFNVKVTSRALAELNMSRIWQRNYYDHIIRNETELIKIREYIETNSLRWRDDQLNYSI